MLLVKGAKHTTADKDGYTALHKVFFFFLYFALVNLTGCTKWKRNMCTESYQVWC